MNRIKAFTLIELSIVLIIIGLLVGGVLAGRDLIKQAQLAGVSRDITNYKTALQTFRLKYGDSIMPGDWDEANSYFSAAANGDGDGRIYLAAERVSFWEHLSLPGLIAGDYNGALGSGANTYSALNMPASSFDGGYYMAVQVSSGTRYSLNFTELGPYWELGARVASNGMPNGELLPTVDAYNLDIKMDDGSADTGQVLIAAGAELDGVSGWGSNCVANANWSSATAGAYDFSTDDAACRAVFRFE